MATPVQDSGRRDFPRPCRSLGLFRSIAAQLQIPSDAVRPLYKIRVGGISLWACLAAQLLGFKSRTDAVRLSYKDSGRRDLNPRHLSPEPSALPAALLPVQKKLSPSIAGWALAGATGLEPAIFGLTGRRDNQLRYAPVTFTTISQRVILVKCFI